MIYTLATDPGNLGLAIEDYRKRNKLSQKEFGAKVNLVSSRVSILEREGNRLAQEGVTWEESYKKISISKKRVESFRRIWNLLRADELSLEKVQEKTEESGTWEVQRFADEKQVLHFLKVNNFLPGEFHIITTRKHSSINVIYWQKNSSTPAQ